MATLGTRRSYKARLLSAIGNQSAEELGALAIDMMENMNRLYDEMQIDDSTAENDTIEYVRPDSSEREKELAIQYSRLHEEYTRRFSGLPAPVDSTTAEIPETQPVADDITIGIDPHTGREETRLGDGIEELVAEEEIFGGE